MCDHLYEIEGQILEITFDENDAAEVVEKKCWRCYSCEAVMDVEEEKMNQVVAAAEKMC